MDANYRAQHQIPTTTPTPRRFAAPARHQKAISGYDGVVSRETPKILAGSGFASCRTDSQSGVGETELMNAMADYGAIYEAGGIEAMYDAIEADAARCPASWFQ